MSSGKWSSDPLKDLEWEGQQAKKPTVDPVVAVHETQASPAEEPNADQPPQTLSSPSQSSVPLAPGYCPHCKRKLLTTLSIMCNWCGTPIENAEYLQRAAKERASRDEAERLRLEAEIEETAKHGVIGRLKKQTKALALAPRKIDPVIAEAMRHGTDSDN